MIDIDGFVSLFRNEVQKTFGERVLFIGLQGSYARGEAGEHSDIDLVVLFDELTASDIAKYEQVLERLPNREAVCGFVSGKAELCAWEPSELFQFYFDTIPLYGSLAFLREYFVREDIVRAVRIGAGSIYHSCVHNMLHEKSGEILAALAKSAVFVLQARQYLSSGRYISRMDELYTVCSASECELLKLAGCVKRNEPLAFEEASRFIFEWAGVVLRSVGK